MRKPRGSSTSTRREDTRATRRADIATSARPNDENRSGSSTSRRAFLGQVAGATAGMMIADRALAEPQVEVSAARAVTVDGMAPVSAPAGTFHPLSREVMVQRRHAAFNLRHNRADRWRKMEVIVPTASDDELLYPSGWASSSRALPHDQLGHPDPQAYSLLVAACTSGRPEDFDAVPLGGTQPLRNPQSGLAFEYCGYDSHQALVPPAPAFSSAWRAAEMVEVYWTSLLRDVPFVDYDFDPSVAEACADLTALSDYRGPKVGGAVTPATIFRGPYSGCGVGPFVSQFLLKDIAFGAQINSQQVRTFAPGIDYLTDYSEWLARQNGESFAPRVYDSTYRYLRNLRDMAAWVDADPPFQHAYHALSILLQMGAPPDPGNPYLNRIVNQDGFVTFGPIEWFDMLARAPHPALEAAWFQKWRIHRTLRPEEFAGRVHNHLTGTTAYPLHADVLQSEAVEENFRRFGSYLCSQAYPDGAPVHPAYPSGHSAGSGSATTMLKAMFDESFVIPDPVQATADGLALEPYIGPPLTVGGELNKLAFNIGLARVAGGIHWRSDVIEGNRLGEAISLSILQDVRPSLNEPFGGYSLRRFNGSPIGGDQ